VAEDAPLVVATSSGGDVAPYALTKAEAEAEVVRAVAEGLSAQILRPPAVLGAGPTSTWGTRVPTRYRDGELPRAPPATTFGYVHVEDLVDAVLASLATPGETRTCNVVGGHTTFGDYLAALRTFLARPAGHLLGEPGGPWRGRYATARLRALGVQPQRTFEEAMDEIAASWSEGDPDHVRDPEGEVGCPPGRARPLRRPTATAYRSR
jgi:2-alkyl-3-oxoalkanoate reductase